MATTNKSPLARQKAEHESKEKLVDRVIATLGAIAKSSEDKDELKLRLLGVSNKKLLKIYDMSSEIKSKFGSVDKLAEAAATALGRAKDAPYVAKLKAYAPSRLIDLYRSTEKRTKKSKAA